MRLKTQKTISDEKGLPVAQKLLEDLGITGMTCVRTQNALLSSFNNQFGMTSNRPDEYCREFTFMRNINGVSLDAALIDELVNYSESISPDDTDYAPPMYAEYIQVGINNDGEVEYFNYNNMMDEDEMLSEGALLKEFDSIVSNGIDQIKYKYSFNDVESGKAFVNIDTIELEMKYARAKDDLEAALLVPVWKFGGTISYEINGTHSNDYSISVFLDAVDGSTR